MYKEKIVGFYFYLTLICINKAICKICNNYYTNFNVYKKLKIKLINRIIQKCIQIFQKKNLHYNIPLIIR